MADKPTNKFKIPTQTVFLNMEGEPMREPGPDGKERDITLGIVLGAAMLADTKVEGMTLTILDRLELARRFRGTKEPEIKVSTNEQIKKIVTENFKHSPLIAGQALELLGDAPSEL